MRPPDERKPGPADSDLAEHEKRLPNEPADTDPMDAVRTGVDDHPAGNGHR